MVEMKVVKKVVKMDEMRAVKRVELMERNLDD